MRLLNLFRRIPKPIEEAKQALAKEREDTKRYYDGLREELRRLNGKGYEQRNR